MESKVELCWNPLITECWTTPRPVAYVFLIWLSMPLVIVGVWYVVSRFRYYSTYGASSRPFSFEYDSSLSEAKMFLLLLWPIGVPVVGLATILMRIGEIINNTLDKSAIRVHEKRVKKSKESTDKCGQLSESSMGDLSL
jgi:hypothetical protein